MESIEKIEKTEVETKSGEEESPKYWTVPTYYAWNDEHKITLEIALPGVKKENIKLQTERNHFILEAKRNQIGYELKLRLREDIEADKTNAKYEQGLLTIELKKYKPKEHAFEVKIE
jgi:HSP20 family molecular chaperone IbpA